MPGLRFPGSTECCPGSKPTAIFRSRHFWKTCRSRISAPRVGQQAVLDWGSPSPDRRPYSCSLEFGLSLVGDLGSQETTFDLQLSQMDSDRVGSVGEATTLSIQRLVQLKPPRRHFQLTSQVEGER